MSETTEKTARNYSQELKDASGDVVKKLEIIDAFVADVLEDKVDYGTIPKVDKMSLFKSGAEKFLDLFEIYADVQVVSRTEDFLTPVTIPSPYANAQPKEVLGFVAYETRCELKSKFTQEVCGGGVGAASNVEGKFAQNAGAVANNVIKSARKRSIVDAVLTLSLVSGRFTQDVEDMDKEQFSGGNSSNSSSSSDVFQFTGGKFSGKYINDPEVDDGYVKWLIEAAKKDIKDPAKAQYLANTKSKLTQYEAEAKRRGLKV